jgi:hypothetical protein
MVLYAYTAMVTMSRCKEMASFLVAERSTALSSG